MQRLFGCSIVTGAALFATVAFTSLSAQQGTSTAAGLWEKTDPAGRPEGWFRITERDGLYEGQIVKMFPKPGEDPSTWRCTQCQGNQKNAPVLGITFIKGMRRSGLKYEAGTILDPRDGATYKALMELSADGRSLTVRGYLGIALFGQSQEWRRLPANSLEPDKVSRPAREAPARRHQGRSPASTPDAPPR